ncbi:MAG TPA: hypothetical protein VF177_09440 [Anaerolineae bacterium]
MKKIGEQIESGVRLLTVELSEDELAVLLASVEYLLDHADDAVLEATAGAGRDEIEGIRDDMAQLLAILQPSH